MSGSPSPYPLTRSGGSSETRRENRVAAFRRIRVGSWNVGSLTGKRLELVDALERHKVDITCFQETKWKGSSNIEGNGYKLWYSGSPTARNGVGVILKACLKDKVVQVNRCSDRIISLTLVIDGETVNVISAYAPQVGLSEVEKKTFWDSLDKVVREFPTDQRLILGGDLNGHIGAATEGYAGVHGGFGYGVRNEEGRAILDFAIAHDLVVVNSHFKKRDHHLVTFQSGGRCTQIDYLLVRRGDLKACKDCKVFPREACSSQHNLLALDMLFKSVQRRRERSALPRILWKNLIGDATEAFRSRVAEGVSTRVEALAAGDANSMWNTLASTIKDAAKDTLGVAIGTSKTHTARRESWWLCEEVQAIVAVKQTRFRELLSCREGNEEERLRAQARYKEAKRQTKKVVAQAKEKAYEDLYKKLDSKEGANDIFRIAKARERRRRDLGDICFIKDEEGRTITDEEEIKKR
ncbi:craniofacial development protein 2 [Tanacetum coccineum]